MIITSRQERDAKLKALKKQIEELENTVVYETRHMPEVGSRYYYTDEVARTSSAVYSDSEFDNSVLLLQDVFATPSDADEDFKRRQMQLHYKRFIEDKNVTEGVLSLQYEQYTIDWNNPRSKKYYAYYDAAARKIEVCYIRDRAIQGTVFSLRVSFIEDFVRLVGEDNFIKYVLNVDVNSLDNSNRLN